MFYIHEILVEHRKEPIGLDASVPGFSWKMESDGEHVLQIAYRLRISCDEEMVWDSGCVNSDQSIHVIYDGDTLLPQTIYTVRLNVWNNKGEATERTTTFETGMMDNAAFTGKWISAVQEDENTALPVFVKQFETSGKIARARLYSSACGIYDVKMNGKKVGDDFLAPGWTNYKSHIQYQTYDITDMVKRKNEMAITVAPGWYTGFYGCEGLEKHYGDRTAAFAEIHLWYADGNREVIKTDESWKWQTGEVRYAQIYNGEILDSTWKEEVQQDVTLFDMDNSRLIAQQCAPVQIQHKLKPKQLIHTPKGEVVLDFGQNIAGMVEVTINGEKGQKIIIRHSEVLDKEGNFYTGNLRLAEATDTFICRGGKQVFRPRFTYHGFRYIMIDGMGKEPDVDDFTACALYTTMEQTAEFSCSNSLVNQLWSNIQWGQNGNFVDIPTDCPQRDERLGWTGDATVFAPTAAHNRDVYLFFKKWLKDLASQQSRENGVPHMIPDLIGGQGGAAVWSDSATMIPWTMYEMYGDLRILKDQYSSMKDWVEYMRGQETNLHLRQCGHQYGDWLALDKEECITRPQGGTDAFLIASIFYAYSTQILYQAAELLGQEQDTSEYRQLYEQIKSGIQKEYITETGRIVSETQTACVLILHFDIAKPEHRERIKQTLIKNLNAHGGHLTTGFIGTPFLCHTLTEIGCHDIAGKLLLNEEYPGWLNEVKLGATTIWERWNSRKADGSFDESGMNSFNHYAFGAIGAWMIEQLAGIQIAEPGYKKIILKPQFIKGLTKVSASRKTPYGNVTCDWSCENGKITVNVTVPVNTTAQLYLPEYNEVQELGSGSYYFSYNTEISLELQKYSMDSTFGDIMEQPLAAELIEQAMPGSTRHAGMEFLRKKRISELLSMMPEGSEALYRHVIEELNNHCEMS